MKVLVELDGTIVLIEIEAFNSQLDYKLLLRRSYVYAMKVMASIFFRLLMFPHDGKIVNFDQLTYYDPKGLATPEHVLLTIISTIDTISIPSLYAIGPGLFDNTPITDTFFSLPNPPTSTEVLDLCTITSSNILTTSQLQSQPQHQPLGNSLEEISTQNRPPK